MIPKCGAMVRVKPEVTVRSRWVNRGGRVVRVNVSLSSGLGHRHLMPRATLQRVLSIAPILMNCTRTAVQHRRRNVCGCAGMVKAF